MERQKEILENAARVLARQTGLNLEYDWPAKRPGPDARIWLLAQGQKFHFYAEIKERVTGVDALLPLVHKTDRPEEFLLVTRYATEETAERLRENGIQFLDEAGNAFIHRPPVYVFIKGGKNPYAAKAPTIGRAFKQTGLKVLYVLLCNPGMENQPYRTIAAQAGVALGMVGWVMNELKELGFLLEQGKGRAHRARLTEKEKLLERWVTGYVEQLRPKLLQGRYRGPEGWWKDAKLRPENALWGGEVAAAKMTGYLKPQDVTIYVGEENPTAVLLPHKLKKDPEGDVELLYRFWKPDAIPPHGDTVHPLLVYADLMATGNQRNLEAARKIYDQHIVQFVRET